MAKTSNGGIPRAWTVAESIRRDILAGRLEPGSRLAFNDLCETYEASVGVLREALIRLVHHGIVKAQSNIGFTVMSLSPENLLDLTSVRAITEPRFAHHSVVSGSVEWESELVAAHHLLARATVLDPTGQFHTEEWLAAHTNFHLKLIAGTHSVRMTGMVTRLRDEADLYRRWYGREGTDAKLNAARTAEEHSELLLAATDRDADRVERLLRMHIRRSAEDILPPGYASIREDNDDYLVAEASGI